MVRLAAGQKEDSAVAAFDPWNWDAVVLGLTVGLDVMARQPVH